MQWDWMLWQCFYPTIQQAVVIGLSIVGPCIVLRLLVLFSGLQQKVLNSIATALGILVLWWYYNTSVAYFAVLCGVVYTLLLVISKRRGAVVSIACVAFILSWYICTNIVVHVHVHAPLYLIAVCS